VLASICDLGASPSGERSSTKIDISPQVWGAGNRPEGGIVTVVANQKGGVRKTTTAANVGAQASCANS
jgi:hypothetical protein